METRNLFNKLCLLLLLFLAAFSTITAAQTDGEEFEPRSGQPGKDVVWVPTTQELVQKMLDLAEVTADDYVIDLGSGDGRTVIAAAKRGARAHGIEYNQEMVELSRKNAEEAGVGDRATFEQADIFESDFSNATVITMFLLTSINVKLRPTLLELEPGTRIVSNTFSMEDWEPDATESLEDTYSTWATALMWIVPAKVAGTWRLPNGTLKLDQSYQMLYGTLDTGNNSYTIENGRMRGSEISFTVGNALYTGVVNGTTIEGTIDTDGSDLTWEATYTGN